MSVIEVNWEPDRKQLSTFGLVCAGVCLALGFWVIWRQTIAGIVLTPGTAVDVSATFDVLAVAAAVLSWLAPAALRPIYIGLTAISLPIGLVLSYLALGGLFYLVFTPYGLVFRLVGRDALSRRFDRSGPSYWLRRPTVTDQSRYFRQY